jgi:hypothetical protein
MFAMIQIVKQLVPLLCCLSSEGKPGAAESLGVLWKATLSQKDQLPMPHVGTIQASVKAFWTDNIWGGQGCRESEFCGLGRAFKGLSHAADNWHE